MYRHGGVPRLWNTYKSAAYIDTSDDGGSETETEQEDGFEQEHVLGECDPFEKEDELDDEQGHVDHDPFEKEDELEEENDVGDYDPFEKEDELMEDDDDMENVGSQEEQE